MEEKNVEIYSTWLVNGEDFLQDSIDSRQKISFPHFKKEDGYKCLYYIYFKSKIMISIDKIDDEFVFRFAHVIDDYIHAAHEYGPYKYNVSSIEYNGVYAYQLSCPDFCDDIFEILYLLSNTNDFCYEVYFFENHISSFNELYFIPKNDKFSKKFLDYFNEDENIHYLDLDKIRELL